MSWLTTSLVEPLYRLIYGSPTGVQAPAEGTGWTGQAAPPRGLVVVADGVGDFHLCWTGLRYVAAAERLPCTIELFAWGHGFGRWYADLTDLANRDARARTLAERVRRFRADRPAEPIFLVGKSGGAGVVLKALELLEAEVVERVVLLAPALSPEYDLSSALRAVRAEIVVFWSPLDVFVLGMGTYLFGTIDRVRTASAGMVGFRRPTEQPGPPGREPSAGCAGLRQVRWRINMAAAGHFGGHFGPDSPAFLRRYVVPLLQTEKMANH